MKNDLYSPFEIMKWKRDFKWYILRIVVLINTGITEQLFKVEKKIRYSFEFDNFTWWIGLDYGVYGNFQEYFSYIGVEDLSQVTDKLYRIMLLAAICTDCTYSCKFNYYTITTTAVPTWCIIKNERSYQI